MPTQINLDGALQPIMVNEPFGATWHTLTSAFNNNTLFFLTKDMEGHPMAVSIPKILWAKDVDE